MRLARLRLVLGLALFLVLRLLGLGQEVATAHAFGDRVGLEHLVDAHAAEKNLGVPLAEEGDHHLAAVASGDEVEDETGPIGVVDRHLTEVEEGLHGRLELLARKGEFDHVFTHVLLEGDDDERVVLGIGHEADHLVVDASRQELLDEGDLGSGFGYGVAFGHVMRVRVEHERFRWTILRKIAEGQTEPLRSLHYR
jgi:hypothetical protein